MGKPPESPYPPDVEDGEPAEAELGDLRDVVVDGADWANGRAPRAELTRVELRRCRLTGADLGGAELTDVRLVDCRLNLVSLRFAKLRRVVFSDCRLEECDLYEASLEDVLLEGCALREATLAGATVRRVEFRRCDLAGLVGAEALRGVRMPWPDVLESAPLLAAALGIEVLDA